MSEPLLRAEGLTRHFRVGKLFGGQVLHAVDDVDFTIGRGEIVALVGESGSGKSTIARLLARGARDSEVGQALGEVGLVPPGAMMAKFPHELSGGQRQRVGFAQALAFRPKLIIADEPVSMLDVSIRIGVLNLMADLREREGVSFLYITHDVAGARYIADRVLVMYAGHLVEQGPIEDVIQRPKHPYTQLLLSAVPDPRAPLGVSDAADVGEPPKVVNPRPGCRFRGRCPYAIETCATVTPVLREIGPGRVVACHVAEPDAAGRIDAPAA